MATIRTFSTANTTYKSTSGAAIAAAAVATAAGAGGKAALAHSPDGKNGAVAASAAFSVVCGAASVDMVRGFVRERLPPPALEALVALPGGDTPYIVNLAPLGVSVAAIQGGAIGLAPLHIRRSDSEADMRAGMESQLHGALRVVQAWNAGTMKTCVFWCAWGALGVFPICCERPLDAASRYILEEHRAALRDIAAAMCPVETSAIFAAFEESTTAIGVAPLFETRVLSALGVGAARRALADMLGAHPRTNYIAITTPDLMM